MKNVAKMRESSALAPKKERQSNMELLRLLSMLFVLVLHADYLSLGDPTAEELSRSPVAMAVRVGIEQAAIVCVNVFVLISGWFGIRPAWRGFLNLMYQLLFCGVLVLLFFLCSGRPVPGILISESLYVGLSWWFALAYIGLYVLAPLLNAFVESVTRRQLRNFLIAFFVWEFFYGWVKNVSGFNNGYSVLSFIGLYLLARYVRMYLGNWSGKRGCVYAGGYAVSTLVSAWLSLGALALGKPSIVARFTAYNSPFVIFGSLCLLLLFSRLDFRSKAVNWLAVSCFSIYLYHCHPLVLPHFTSFFSGLYERFGGAWYLLLAPCCLLAVGMACILADRLRLLTWNRLWPWLQRSIPALRK